MSSIPAGFRALPLPISQLCLSAVLKCGQSFRWTSLPLSSSSEKTSIPEQELNPEPTHEYRFCLKDRVVCLRQSKDNIYYRSACGDLSENASSCSTSSKARSSNDERENETLVFLRDYFQLEIDLNKLYDDWSSSDPVFKNLRHRFSGIRILRQDPWECLISFICSSNNNITRISKMVHNLCIHFSPCLVKLDDPIAVGCETAYHPFPPPSILAAPSVGTKLRELGFGYRADFIQKTAAMLIQEHGSDEAVFKHLSGLRLVDTESARAELLKLIGVGRKVADCILLMSLDKREVVPVDTHVHQIAVKHYGMKGSSSGKTSMTPKLYDEVNAKFTKIWGPYAGWTHSILFTADLKSFSTYGLPTPSSSVTPASNSPQPSAGPLDFEETPPTPKRKRKQVKTETKNVRLTSTVVVNDTLELEGDNLAERVKRRRRGVAVTVKDEL